MATTTRRTPALTKRIRELYEEMLFRDGYWPGSYDVAKIVGLSSEQVRDAVWDPKADEWRRDVVRRYSRRSEELCP